MNTFGSYPTPSEPSGRKPALVQADALPHLAALSGASPTAYFVWRQMMESSAAHNNNGKGSESDDEKQQEAAAVILTRSYNDIHLSTFQSFEENELNTLIENSPLAELNKQDHNGNSPLVWAASEGREDIVTLLVEQGADINCQNYEGETALYVAAARGHARMAEFLVLNGANVHIGNLDGATPIHIAAAEGHKDVLRVFSHYYNQNGNKNLLFNVQDLSGDTPLHYAVREGRMDIVQFLVSELRVQVDVRNEDLETPLELASCLGETAMVHFLAQHSSSAASAFALRNAASEEDAMLFDHEIEPELMEDQQEGNWKAFQAPRGNFQHVINQPVMNSAVSF